MSAVDAPIDARLITRPESKLRRGLRRYGLPAIGALVILAWVIVAGLAPVLSPYLPSTVDVTARMNGQIECSGKL